MDAANVRSSTISIHKCALATRNLRQSTWDDRCQGSLTALPYCSLVWRFFPCPLFSTKAGVTCWKIVCNLHVPTSTLMKHFIGQLISSSTYILLLFLYSLTMKTANTCRSHALVVVEQSLRRGSSTNTWRRIARRETWLVSSVRAP